MKRKEPEPDPDDNEEEDDSASAPDGSGGGGRQIRDGQSGINQRRAYVEDLLERLEDERERLVAFMYDTGKQDDPHYRAVLRRLEDRIMKYTDEEASGYGSGAFDPEQYDSDPDERSMGGKPAEQS
jgi:hypothetical protein